MTALVSIPRAASLEEAVDRGPRWRPIADLGEGPHAYGDGRPMRVVVSCPSGQLLGLPHDVGDDGRVSPSIVCRCGCGWHVFGRLEDWASAPRAPERLESGDAR